jgi:hypothetical protein
MLLFSPMVELDNYMLVKYAQIDNYMLVNNWFIT